MKTMTVDGYTVRIGQNEKENWVLLEKCNSNDYLFHLSSFPSCYVILENGKGIDIPREILEKVGNVCISNTKHRKSVNVKVDCTKCENVIKGDRMGELIYKSKRCVLVL